MEHGDLAMFSIPRTVVILEGVLAKVPPMRVRRRKVEFVSPDEWEWNIQALQRINYEVEYHSRIFDVVTFRSQRVADEAADWFLRYDVRVASVEYHTPEVFRMSLKWRSDIHMVVDSDPERLDTYGPRLGYQIQYGDSAF